MEEKFHQQQREVSKIANRGRPKKKQKQYARYDIPSVTSGADNADNGVEENNSDARKVDKSVFKCPKCGRAWEKIGYMKTELGRLPGIHVYPNEFGYGKKEKVCTSCIVREGMKNGSV